MAKCIVNLLEHCNFGINVLSGSLFEYIKVYDDRQTFPPPT